MWAQEHELGALFYTLSLLWSAWREGKPLDELCMSSSAVREAWMFLASCIVVVIAVEYQRWRRRQQRTMGLDPESHRGPLRCTFLGHAGWFIETQDLRVTSRARPLFTCADGIVLLSRRTGHLRSVAL